MSHASDERLPLAFPVGVASRAPVADGIVEAGPVASKMHPGVKSAPDRWRPDDSVNGGKRFVPARFGRRDFLRALGVAAALPLLDGAPSLRAQAAKPTMHVYPNYGWLRGLGIVPSWGANIVEAWQLYDGARFRGEVALARTIHCNCIRLWIEFAAWQTDPKLITGRFFDAVAGIAENPGGADGIASPPSVTGVPTTVAVFE